MTDKGSKAELKGNHKLHLYSKLTDLQVNYETV